MQNRTKWIAAAAAATTVFAAGRPAPANANPVLAVGDIVTMSANNVFGSDQHVAGTIKYNNYSANVGIGMFSVSASVNGGPSQSLDFVCDDIFGTIPTAFASLTYIVRNLAPPINEAGQLQVQVLPNENALFSNYFSTAQKLAPTDANVSAGFQLAAWELYYDPYNYNITAGSFSAITSPGAIADAQAFLTNIEDGTWKPEAGYEVFQLTSADGHQNQLVGEPVPEPSSLYVLGAGLIGLGFLSRSRLKL